MKSPKVVILILSLVMSACASSPFTLEGVNQSITPALATATPEYQQQTALWGGLIIQSRNMKNNSEIEVLSYPLNDNGEPNRGANAQGRFLIQHDGYLETAEYAPGRWVSAVGTVQPPVQGKVGTADYTFAVIRARQLHLWPEGSQTGESKTQFHFGIGIGIHR